ncbi:MAG: hypothetical protein L3J23_01000 [Flavobacteriaceae bacterium]|nr:hypothetical protein [Flavobacteriaceae bacterium]
MKNAILDRDFDLGGGEIVNVSTDERILFSPYNISAYQIDLIKKCRDSIKKLKTRIKIRKYIKKFPKVPHFEELLVVNVLASGTEEEYEVVVRKFFLKFPNFFYAKLHMARVYLYYEQYNEISNLYGDTLKLSTAFPNRKVFFIHEMKQFLYFSVSYFITKGRIKAAKERLYQMSTITGSSAGIYKNAQKMIKSYCSSLAEEKKESIIVTTNFEKSLNKFDFLPKIKRKIINLNNKFNNDNLKDNSNLLVQSQIAAEKYPKVPHFKTFIVQYYIANRDHLNVVAAVQELYNLHPNFLLTKIFLSELLLRTEDLEYGIKKIFELFNKDLILDVSIQKEYSAVEYLSFYFIAGKVWLYKKRPDLAEKCLNNLSRVNTDSNQHILLQKEISKYYTKNYNNLN